MRYDSFASRLQAAFSSWRDAKLVLERSVEVSAEFIHIVVGVVILLIAAGILRRPVSSWRPWLVVLSFAFVNEVIDMSLEHWAQAARQLGESINDLLVTMLMPTILLVTARKSPGLYCAVPVARPDRQSDGGDPA